MVLSQLAELRTPAITTTDFLYLRFIIGDRTIDEKDFGRIQKDRVMEMKNGQVKLELSTKKEEEESDGVQDNACSNKSNALYHRLISPSSRPLPMWILSICFDISDLSLNSE
jgi:hypothetical protein